MKRQIVTRIETLPNKVRLNTTRANQGNIDDLKNNSKGYTHELEDDGNEKESDECTSSVYGKTLYFLSLDIFTVYNLFDIVNCVIFLFQMFLIQLEKARISLFESKA